MVKNMVRWALFCAATGRKMRKTLDWEPFYAIAEKDLPYRDRLRQYAAIARERMEADRFREFCEKHLSHVDEVAWEFFGSERARELVNQKVAALYPAHEVEKFTDHFFGLIQFWRKTERDRLDRVAAARPAPTTDAIEVKSEPAKKKRASKKGDKQADVEAAS